MSMVCPNKQYNIFSCNAEMGKSNLGVLVRKLKHGMVLNDNHCVIISPHTFQSPYSPLLSGLYIEYAYLVGNNK